jgi:hypothetical protein
MSELKKQTDVEKSLEVLESLIEQVMSSGGFKKLADLDACRQALTVLSNNAISKQQS